MQQLQLLHVLENNPAKGEKAIQEILNAMRYQ